MKIIVYRARRAGKFDALLQCEHCHITTELVNGVDDARYYNIVMPDMRCHNCQRNRDGNLPVIPPLPEVA